MCIPNVLGSESNSLEYVMIKVLVLLQKHCFDACRVHLCLCIWQTLWSKATFIAFKVHIYILPVLAFPENQTDDLDIAHSTIWATGSALKCMNVQDTEMLRGDWCNNSCYKYILFACSKECSRYYWFIVCSYFLLASENTL